ncbi:MAG: creatininase family protein [Alphaproteobacteria bacterium]
MPRLQLSTWQEVDAYLLNRRDIIMPIGSTQQHGPNGLIGTDSICPEVIADGVAKKDGVMVGPTLSIGMAQHHMAFAGTITYRPQVLIETLKDVVASLSKHGFERIYFLNGHGGNIATITAAFSEIYTEISVKGSNQPFRLKLQSWFMGSRFRKLSKELYGDSEGSHATPSEVSLSYYAFPDFVKKVVIEPKIAPRGPIRDADDYRRRFPDGRIGSDPSLSTVAHGERIFKASVEDVAEDLKAFVDEA